MKVSFLGAAQTVTGSQHLLTIGEHKILLDCGLYQGSATEAYQRNSQFGFDPKELGAVLVSHAHIDHIGNLPTLVSQGYEGPVYTTHVTEHLAEVMLRDSARIQEADAEYLNQKRAQGGGKGPRVKPLYTEEDAIKVGKLLERVPYNKPFELAPGVQVQFVEAGHILGSAAVVMDVEEDGQIKRVWYSGDIGRLNLPIVRDPVLPNRADALIMECTYGSRSHASPEEGFTDLQETLKTTLERGGRVIIPAFAVGRTQELVYNINRMMEAGEIPQVPVYVDSPLAVETSKIFINHPQFFDDEAHEFTRENQDRSVLGFDRLTYIQSVQESKGLNDQEGPLIIISASGMAESGRVVHHIVHAIGDPGNTILIVSYQAPNTLGRALADGEKQVEIFDDLFEVKAKVKVISGFSAHAGQDFLVEYALASKETLKQVFLVHGEEDAAEALRGRLKAGGIEKIYFPMLKQTMEI